MKSMCNSVPCISSPSCTGTGSSAGGFLQVYAGGWKKKSIVRHVYFLEWTPFCPPPPTHPLQCPHPNKRGTNLLLFKFCIHLHTKLVKSKAREMLRAKK